MMNRVEEKATIMVATEMKSVERPIITFRDVRMHRNIKVEVAEENSKIASEAIKTINNSS
ncbi:hypothetical protein PS1_023765 [Malus domestica]